MTAARTLQAVLIDLDGTLIDPGRGVGAAVRAAADALDLPAPTDALLRRFVGPPIQEGFAELLGLNAVQTAVAIKAFRREYAAGGLYDFDVYPGVPEMLAELSANGLRLAVATSKPEHFAVDVLRHAELIGAFESVHGATLDGKVRHKAQVVTAALHHLVVPADRAVLLGDRAQDAAGAHACGTECVGAGWGFGDPGELRAAGVLVTAERPVDVASLIADWRKQHTGGQHAETLA